MIEVIKKLLLLLIIQNKTYAQKELSGCEFATRLSYVSTPFERFFRVLKNIYILHFLIRETTTTSNYLYISMFTVRSLQL